MILIRWCVILGLLASSLLGCAIPMHMEVLNKTDPYEIKLQLERWQSRKRMAGYNRIRRLRDARLKKKMLLRLPKQEKELILQSFNDSGIILKAFEKLGCSMFDMAGFLNEYGKTDMDGFCDYLATKYPFTEWFRWAVDREVFIPAQRNYDLLKRLNEKTK